MFIALVDFETRPEDKAAALAALQAEAPQVHALPGCLAFRILADPSRPGALSIRHEWASAADFAFYLASPGFSRSGAILRPLMINPPVSRRFEAKLLETV